MDPRQQPDSGPTIPAGQLYRLAWVVYLVLALAGGLWVGLREGGVGLSLFLDLRGWWVDLGLGVGGGGALLALWELARRSLERARELEARLSELLVALAPGEAIALALISGFAEELFFRAAVQGSFTTYGWLWASVLFAVLHSGPGRAFRFWSLFALAAGLVFGGLMVWRGNLLAPMAAHTIVNAVNLRRLAGGREALGEGG